MEVNSSFPDDTEERMKFCAHTERIDGGEEKEVDRAMLVLRENKSSSSRPLMPINDPQPYAAESCHNITFYFI